MKKNIFILVIMVTFLGCKNLPSKTKYTTPKKNIILKEKLYFA